MMTCQICKKEFEDRSLRSHITKIHKNIITPEQYYTKFIDPGKVGVCLVCQQKTKFNSFSDGYAKYCSPKCAANSETVKIKRENTVRTRYGVSHVLSSDSVRKKIQNTSLERYGETNPMKNENIKKKVKDTNLKRYGVEYSHQNKEVLEKWETTMLDTYGFKNPSKCPEIAEKRRNTFREKYGVECSFQDAEIRRKIEDTNLNRYGVTVASKSDIVKKKMELTNFEKYGCHPSKLQEIKKKIINTRINRYGSSNLFSNLDIFKKYNKTVQEKYRGHPFKNVNIKEKIRKTVLGRYGVENVSSLEFVKKKRIDTNRERYGCDYYTQSSDFLKKMFETSYNKLITSDRLKNLVRVEFSLDEYLGVSDYDTKYPFSCVKCGNKFSDHIMNGHIPRCPSCNPPYAIRSYMELDVYNFCKNYFPNTISGDRSLLDGKEIDVYIPEINLGIEFDGLYWHSEDAHSNKYYHIEKTNACNKKNVSLVHVFEDEWVDKNDIIKSLLRNKMGKIQRRVFARKCSIKSVNTQDACSFLFENHLQGPILGKYLGLYFDDELVSIICYGSSRYNKKYDLELYRFCNKNNTIVVGGFSKLLSHLSKLYSGKKMITYADRRYCSSNNTVYHQTGFNFLGSTGPNYFYIKNGKRENRLNYQKHMLKDKLLTFDDRLTEWENMQINNYTRIWDCGNFIFEKVL